MHVDLEYGEVELTKNTPLDYSAEIEDGPTGTPIVHFTTPGYETEDSMLVEGGFSCEMSDLPAHHLEALATIDELKEKIEFDFVEFVEEWEQEGYCFYIVPSGDDGWYAGEMEADKGGAERNGCYGDTVQEALESLAEKFTEYEEEEYFGEEENE